jgi:hypothetical protein
LRFEVLGDVVRNAINAVQVFQTAGVLWKLPLGDDLALDQPHLAKALIRAFPLAEVKSRIEVMILPQEIACPRGAPPNQQMRGRAYTVLT